MSALTSMITGLLIGAIIIYLILRVVARTPASDLDGRDTARSHAFWTAIIALFASGTAGLADAGTIPVNENPPNEPFNSNWWKDLTQFITPALSVAGIYVIGQFTWPGPRKPVRTADLSVRRVKDFLSVPLTAIAAFFAGAVLAAAAVITPLPAIQEIDIPRTAGGSTFMGQLTAYHAGDYYAGLLTLTTAVLVVGAAAAGWVITRRRPVETLSVDNDRILRRISMNRLLRTTVLLLAGLFNIATGYLRDYHRMAEYVHGPFFGPYGSVDPQLWNTISNVTGIVMLVTALAMLAWSPPQLTSTVMPANGGPGQVPSPQARRLREALRLINASRTLAFAAGGIFLLVGLGLMPAPLAFSLWPPTFVVIVYIAVLTGGELILKRNYGARDGSLPRSRSTVLLETWMKVILAASALITIIAFAVVAVAMSEVDPAGGYLVAVISTCVVIAAGSAAAALVRRRASVTGITPHGDLYLRRVATHRIARITAAGLLASAAQLLVLYPATWTMLFAPESVTSQGPSIPVQMTMAGLLAAAVVVAFIPRPELVPADDPPHLQVPVHGHGRDRP